MHPFHKRVARIGLAVAAPYGFCLAGGYAVQAHGMVRRQSKDIDLFTTMTAVAEFPAAVKAVLNALRDDGLEVSISRQGPTFAQLDVVDPASGEQCGIDLGADWRAYPPVAMEIGPVLHADDAVANKVCALFGRAAMRDYIDVHGVLSSGRYTGEELLRLAAEHDPGFDREMFAGALRAIERYPQAAFDTYAMTTVDADVVRSRLLAWADDIEGRVGMTPRGWAAVALGGLLVAMVVTATLLVPWHRPPAPRADQLAALRDLPHDQVARGRAFRAALRPGSYGAMGLGLLVAMALGLTPLGARLVEAIGGHWIVQAVVGGLAVVFAGQVVTLPFAAWRHTVLVRYGLSTQTWGPWAVDQLKSYAVSAVIGAVGLLGFYAIARLAGSWWWLPGALGAAGLVVLLSFVLPVLVEPVFNKFTPMEPGPLRTELVALAARDGVPVRDVLVADASRRTRSVNAYVSGLGPTRRIVVYDTLLKEATPDEVTSVVAHELGHAKDRDVFTGTLIGALGAAAAVIAMFLLGGWSGLLRRAGIDEVGEPRSVALLIAVVAIAGLVSAPAQSLVSRRIEARADQHALKLTDDPATFEAMQRRLSKVNLSDPDPNRWEHLFFATHPSTVERMAAARAYARHAS